MRSIRDLPSSFQFSPLFEETDPTLRGAILQSYVAEPEHHDVSRDTFLERESTLTLSVNKECDHCAEMAWSPTCTHNKVKLPRSPTKGARRRLSKWAQRVRSLTNP